MPDGYSNKNEQTCCFCLPLDTGMKVMGWTAMLVMVTEIIKLIMTFIGSFVIGLVSFTFNLVPLYVIYRWYLWLREDSEENSRKLVTGMKILLGYVITIGTLLSILLMTGTFMVDWLARFTPDPNDDDEIRKNIAGIVVSFILACVAEVLLVWYFYRVTVRYYYQKHD